MPIIGEGAGVWSFVHIADVAEATVLAAEGKAGGLYNVVDDEPATVAEWLPVLADVMAAPSPRHVPDWLAKLILPEHLRVINDRSKGWLQCVVPEQVQLAAGVR